MELTLTPRSTLVTTRLVEKKQKKNSSALKKQTLWVFSHLRWDFVKQRPQHLLERFSKVMPVYFIEEPIAEEDGQTKILKIHKNLTVIQPTVGPEDVVSFQKMLKQVMSQFKSEIPLFWLYSAAFFEAVKDVPHFLTIYDCMDELSAFHGASPQLIRQERELLEEADIVFTGGKSLYEAKSELNDNVYCFPSSVERDHFEKALKESTKVPADLAAVPGPRVGFYGVIDERIDQELLQQVARKLPKVSFVMIGPVVKIDAEKLPKEKNIYYLGNKAYADLPNYLKGFSVAFMPFALNESTRFISPTKTLEFMAAHKPIVSTAIVDVVRDYQKEVKIAHNPEGFARLIREAVHEKPITTKSRVKLQEAVMSRTSWDRTSAEMQKIISEAILQNLRVTEKVASAIPATA
jgi:glycosyltransferase involved in cell wall biosynthesis